MAFEPLQTDEPYRGPAEKKRDMDTQMLFGCSGFVLVSVGGYLLSVWPFFAFRDVGAMNILVLCLASGLVPAVILGMVGTSRFGLPAACGFIAGALTTAIFLYLRLQQAVLAGLAQQTPPPDWPANFVGLVPLAWVLLAIALSIAVYPREPAAEA